MNTRMIIIFHLLTSIVPLSAMTDAEDKTALAHQPTDQVASHATVSALDQNMANSLGILAHVAAQHTISAHITHGIPQQQKTSFRYILPKPAPVILKPNPIELFTTIKTPESSVKHVSPALRAKDAQTSKKRKKDTQNSFPCIKCLDEKLDHPKLTAHILTQHTSFRLYTCEQSACTYKTNNFSDYKKHYFKNHTSESVPSLSLAKKREINRIINPFLYQLGHSFVCHECEGLFAHQLALKCHIGKDHKPKSLELPAESPLKNNGLNDLIGAESCSIPAAAQSTPASLDLQETAAIPLLLEGHDFEIENLALILEFATASASPTQETNS